MTMLTRLSGVALAAVVGLLPPVLGVRRVHLMAVLVPAIVLS